MLYVLGYLVISIIFLSILIFIIATIKELTWGELVIYTFLSFFWPISIIGMSIVKFIHCKFWYKKIL